MYKPTDWEQREIERLSKKEADEPEFVTKRKKEMITLIKQGKGDEIVYDEWGHVSYPVTTNTHD